MSKALLLAGLLWCLPVSGWAAAPTYDAADNSGAKTNQQNPSYTHTPSGAACPNCVEFIGVCFQDSTPGTLSSVTSGGNAATSLGVVLDSGGGNKIFGQMFIYKNAGTSPTTIQANFSEVMNSVTIHAMTIKNVDQVTSTGTRATATGASTAPSVNVSSTAGELVVDLLCSPDRTATVGAGQTDRVNVNDVGNHRHAASHEAGATTTTMSWTLGSAADWGIQGIAFKPATDATACRMMLLGVGC